MKKSRSSSVTSGRLPVSARFYTNMLERIANSCSAINRQELYDETVGIIREYLLDGIVPDTECRTEIILIFTLLRPEIDKAMVRSAAARRRKFAKSVVKETAGSRRTEIGRVTTGSEIEHQSTVNDGIESGGLDSNPEDGPRLNRSQRRLVRQELRRAGRKRNKPLQMH